MNNNYDEVLLKDTCTYNLLFYLGLTYFYKYDYIIRIKYLKLLYKNTNYTDSSVCENIVIYYEESIFSSLI